MHFHVYVLFTQPPARAAKLLVPTPQRRRETSLATKAATPAAGADPARVASLLAQAAAEKREGDHGSGAGGWGLACVRPPPCLRKQAREAAPAGRETSRRPRQRCRRRWPRRRSGRARRQWRWMRRMGRNRFAADAGGHRSGARSVFCRRLFLLLMTLLLTSTAGPLTLPPDIGARSVVLQQRLRPSFFCRQLFLLLMKLLLRLISHGRLALERSLQCFSCGCGWCC